MRLLLTVFAGAFAVLLGVAAALGAGSEWVLEWKQVAPIPSDSPILVLPDGVHVMAGAGPHRDGPVLVNVKTGYTKPLPLALHWVPSLVWSSGRHCFALSGDLPTGSYHHGLWVSRADFSELRLLDRQPYTQGVDGPWPVAWLRNDTWLVCHLWHYAEGEKPGTREGRLFKVDGSRRRPALQWETEAVWSGKSDQGARVHKGAIEVRPFGMGWVKRYALSGPGRYEVLDFSDDARYIAYARYHGKKFAWGEGREKELFTPGSVWLLDTATGKHQHIVGGNYAGVRAAFSPQSDRLACSLTLGSEGCGSLCEACVASVPQGQVRFLVAPPGSQGARGSYRLKWSPDGRRLEGGNTLGHSESSWLFDRDGNFIASLEKEGWHTGESGLEWLPAGNRFVDVLFKDSEGYESGTLFVATISRRN